MSKEGVVSFVEKAINDEAFQAELKENPEAALSQFDLTEEEKSAIKSGSEEELKALGLDERLSKMTPFGGGTGIPGLPGGP